MIELRQVELLSLGLAIALLFVAPPPARRMHASLLRWLGRLGARPVLVAVVLGLGVVLVAAIHAHFVHWPEPSVHDEFAYILGAETFAGGELARPTPAHWEHFESFHILLTPSYAPKYPPGHSLVLAGALSVFGEVRYGLWLEAGALVASITWMLFAFVPARFAVLGGIACALQLALFGSWSMTFYGGSLAAIGGALMLGAAPRVSQRPGVGLGVVLGLGIAILAMTRPFEGFVATFAVIAWLIIRCRARARDGSLSAATYAGAAVGAGAVVSLGLAFIGAHNHATTGDVFRLPYAEYDAQYSVYPPFLFQEPAPAPAYRHSAIEDFSTTFQSGERDLIGGPRSYTIQSVLRQVRLVLPILGLVLVLPLLGAVLALRRRTASLAIGTWVLVSLALTTTTFCFAHYAAPGAGALYALAFLGWSSAWSRSKGRWRDGVAAAGLAVLAGLVVVAGQRSIDKFGAENRHFGLVRSRVIDRLEREPGRDLVIVETLPGHSFHHEFVYNAADIEAADIVWARDMGAEKNAALAMHYTGREIWRLQVGTLESEEIVLERESF